MNTLTRDINQFIACRVEARDIGKNDELSEDQNTMLNILNDLSTELIKAGSTKFGANFIQIHEYIYDSIMNTCCRYQEDGFRKGFVDGFEVGKFMTSTLRA